MTRTTLTFVDPDGYEIFVYKWSPETSTKAAVQVAHGAAEHALRYERFAHFLNDAGFIVYGNDHRGHGKTAASLDKAGIAGDQGWNGMVNDAHQLTQIIKDENPGIPVFLFGHSMGSMIAQHYIQQWGDELQGVILSGTFGSLGDDTAGTAVMAEQMAQEHGATTPSVLFEGMFSSFNEPFEPGKTGFEWLSRDDAEVQKYVDDPWCGFPFCNRLVADMFAGAQEMWTPENEARIPKDLPVLVVSGDKDPAGGFTASVQVLLDRYAEHGLANVTSKFYAGARHEILNETNRDEVHQDILDWLESQLD
jgi:alpha-beta hydrolase superfamily lysophospholipase